MANNFKMSGSEILESLEKHCNEKIQCSSRLRFQIIETLNRMVSDHNKIITRIELVLEGYDVFDPTEKTAIRLPK